VNCFQTNWKQSTYKFKKVLKTGLLYAFHVQQVFNIDIEDSPIYWQGKYCILLIMSEKKLFHIICWEGRWRVLCVAIIKQTIPSVGLGILILGFPKISDKLTSCNFYHLFYLSYIIWVIFMFLTDHIIIQVCCCSISIVSSTIKSSPGHAGRSISTNGNARNWYVLLGGYRFDTSHFETSRWGNKYKYLHYSKTPKC
jgi:hypothetical protein